MDLKGFSFSLNPSENNGALLLGVTTKFFYPCINNWLIGLTSLRLFDIRHEHNSNYPADKFWQFLEKITVIWIDAGYLIVQTTDIEWW